MGYMVRGWQMGRKERTEDRRALPTTAVPTRTPAATPEPGNARLAAWAGLHGQIGNQAIARIVESGAGPRPARSTPRRRVQRKGDREDRKHGRGWTTTSQGSVMITSLDEVVIALFITGGPNSTLTKRMFTALRDEIDPTIAAISSMLIVTSLAIVLAAALAGGRRRRRS